MDKIEQADVKTFKHWEILPKHSRVLVSNNGLPLLYKAFFIMKSHSVDKIGGTTIYQSEMKLDSEAVNIYAFTEWFGGNCPVDKNEVVLVLLRSGKTHANLAANLSWRWDDSDSDIVAYSVIK